MIDYSQYIYDPDLLVEWEAIEQVVSKRVRRKRERVCVLDHEGARILVFCFSFIQRFFCSDIPSCPICLHPPTAGNLTPLSLSFSLALLILLIKLMHIL